VGFIRRFTEQPPVEVIRQIEGLNIVDIAPPDPTTGAGSGTVLLVGEFEDGFFATDEEAKGSVEVFGSGDYVAKFGEFGYTYNGQIASNPSARRHVSEDWNGSGYMKSFKLRAQRLIIGRVDTSVGEVSFDPLVCLSGGGAGGSVFNLAVGDTFSATTNTGAGTTAAIAGAVATRAGAGAAFGTILSGESFAVSFDGGSLIPVVFQAADTAVGAVVSRINTTVGATIAVDNAGQLDISGLIEGTDGNVTLSEVTAGLLAKLGHTAGSTDGTGTFGNVDAVTASELAAFITADASMIANDVLAEVLSDGTLRICNSVSATASTLLIPSSGNPIGVAVGLPLDTTATLADNEAGTIPAGTRVRNAGGDEWVTMQTLDIPAATLGPYTVKIRPAEDDGTATGESAGGVNVIVDQPTFAGLVVNNNDDVSAALNEVQMDNAYIAAFEASLDDQGAAKEANYLLSARRSETVVREGRNNANKATECGMAARKFITGDPLGTDTNTIIENIAKFRSDRVFYTGKGMKVRIPGIAERGVAGGTGFTADGIITVRPDGPLATICASRPPEENPGQETRLIEDFFEVDTFGETLSIETYKAYRREGVIVPRVDRVAGVVMQSGVTSSLATGRKTCARRKMADFIQDTLANNLIPFSKKLNTQSRRNSIKATANSFLVGLRSDDNPELKRIEDFSIDDSVNAGNTSDSLALGIYRLAIKVRTLASLDFIVVTVEAGENAIIVNTN
jgi:hypothetical protein